MMIHVWHGCRTVGQFNVVGAPGPDIHIDPWNDLLGPVDPDGGVRPMPKSYHAQLSVMGGPPRRHPPDTRAWWRKVVDYVFN